MRRCFGLAFAIEETELDARRVGGEQGEVGAATIPGGAAGERHAATGGGQLEITRA